MLKGLLRYAHTDDVALNIDWTDKRLEKQRMVGEVIDGKTFQECRFVNFVFLDCGMKGVKFVDCKFHNCVFSGCYMKDVKFENCHLLGCHFEICTTSGMKIENSSLAYLEFFRCFIPFNEFFRNLGPNHSSNDKMLLNCAAEAHRVGRWRDAERFLAEHMKEKRKLWKEVVLARQPFYKDNNTWISRIRDAGRYSLSYAMSLAFGDNASILRFCVPGFLLFFIFGPFTVFLNDTNSINNHGIDLGQWLDGVIHFAQRFWSYTITYFNLMLGTQLQTQYEPTLSNAVGIEIFSRVTGIIYLAVLGNLCTKSVGNGPRW